jgi:predicted nucleotidyltransferase
MKRPQALERLVDDLADSRGVEAVVLGGSRAAGGDDAASDWDLGVLYRGDLDLEPLSRWGEVAPPGAWGRLMNGGAWLSADRVGMEHKVDVMLRDLDVIEHWTAEAQAGRYELDTLPGYVAGIPTYVLTAEVSVATVLRGQVDIDTRFPDALAVAAPMRWRFDRDFALMYVEMLVDRAAGAAALGQMAKAIICEAHARMCEQRRWVLNEKRLVATAGLHDAEARLLDPGRTPSDLLATARDLAALLTP